MTTVVIDVHPHPGQREVHESPARFKVLACGRRWGKTRLGVNECLDVAAHGGRAWWVAPSYKMSEVGWRPLARLATQAGGEVRKGERQIALANGGTVTVRSADNPDSLRGEGLDFAVLDECAYMQADAWRYALRPALSDRRGRALFISTPHGLNWFRDLWEYARQGQDSEWAAWQFTTADNPHIDPTEIEAARRILLSRIFRQEYEADFLTDAPGALWKRAWLDSGRVLRAPDLRRIVVAVDPSATARGDECGVLAVGADYHGALYILEDASIQGGPEVWARAAITLYHKLRADCLVAESNQGGEMVRVTLQTVAPGLPVKLVHASRGKAARAEPVAALYEQGGVHHVGEFARLEDELCQWEDDGRHPSPNRLDALVWAVTELTQSYQVVTAWADEVRVYAGY